MKTKKIKGAVCLVGAVVVLAVSSCRSQYHFPGGFKKRRVPAKGCGCPSYSYGADSATFKHLCLYQAVDAGEFAGR
ncbi:MAG: hypothetical protein K2L50_04475 [Bacteroidales bacterium]|nr:hypothetical protein [Bacteroidales bacterium]